MNVEEFQKIYEQIRVRINLCQSEAKNIEHQITQATVTEICLQFHVLMETMGRQFTSLLKQTDELAGAIKMIGDETLANSNTIKGTEEQIRRNSEQIASIEERKNKENGRDKLQGLRNNRIQEEVIFDNIFDLLAQQLGVEVRDLKGVIHRNIAAETPEEEAKESQLMDHNKVSQRILETLLIFNGRNKRKQFYGERGQNAKLISIFHIRNMYTILKRKEKIKVQNTTIKYHKDNSLQQRQHIKWENRQVSTTQKNNKPWRHEELNQLKQEFQSLKMVLNQKNRSKIVEEVQEQQDQEAIYCERCGSGPYISASSYKSHIYQKHDGKTPSKNKYGKSGAKRQGN